MKESELKKKLEDLGFEPYKTVYAASPKTPDGKIKNSRLIKYRCGVCKGVIHVGAAVYVNKKYEEIYDDMNHSNSLSEKICKEHMVIEHPFELSIIKHRDNPQVAGKNEQKSSKLVNKE